MSLTKIAFSLSYHFKMTACCQDHWAWPLRLLKLLLIWMMHTIYAFRIVWEVVSIETSEVTLSVYFLGIWGRICNLRAGQREACQVILPVKSHRLLFGMWYVHFHYATLFFLTKSYIKPFINDWLNWTFIQIKDFKSPSYCSTFTDKINVCIYKKGCRLLKC